jgi:hypothetical protein
MTGRPSDFTIELADLICERLADGESLRSICSEEEMPNKATVFRWLAANRAFSDQYARAREEQAESLADEIVSIADEGETKSLIGKDDETIVVYDSTAVARNRLRVDARKWVASKLKPKRYGDKTTTELTGPDGGPVELIERRIIKPA